MDRAATKNIHTIGRASTFSTFRGRATHQSRANQTQQTDCQQVLPDAAQFQIFPTLVADPEPPAAKQLRHARPFTEQTATDHRDERDEQQVRPHRKTVRLVAAQGATKKQRGGHIRSGDPHDGALQMPGTHQIARKDVLELEAVETARVCAIVRGSAAHQGLEQKHQRNDDIELDQRALTGTGFAGLRVGADHMAATDPAQIVKLSKCQEDRGDTSQQHQQA